MKRKFKVLEDLYSKSKEIDEVLGSIANDLYDNVRLAERGLGCEDWNTIESCLQEIRNLTNLIECSYSLQIDDEVDDLNRSINNLADKYNEHLDYGSDFSTHIENFLK